MSGAIRRPGMPDSGDVAPVVVIGNFDGVHVGHRAMIRRARDRAGGEGVVWIATFHPHPQQVIARRSPGMLCRLDERIDLLVEAGADRVEVIAFTAELSNLAPRAFVEQWLVDRLGACVVVVGDNFRFGAGASGTVETLVELGAELGFEVDVFPLESAGGDVVSSSRVRSLLRDGDVASANRLLGREFSLSGPVVHGAQRGRELGVPTANLGVEDDLLVPGDGVYAGSVLLGGERWPAAISVGTNPQFTEGEAPVTVEAHLIGYVGPDFYDETIVVSFASWIRGQRTFPDVDALVAQIREDIAGASATTGTG